MKKNVMVAGLIMVSTILFAQRHNGDPAARAGKNAEKMKTELSLNDDQYARVKAINEKFGMNYTKLRGDTSQTVGTMRNRMNKLSVEKEAQLKSVLTDAQWTKWTALKTKRNEDRKNHKGGKHERGE